MAKKKSFGKWPLGQKVWIIGASVLALGLVALAQKDLLRRGPDEVRGNIWMWRVLCLNATGAVAYFLIGRVKKEEGPAAGGAVSPTAGPSETAVATTPSFVEEAAPPTN